MLVDREVSRIAFIASAAGGMDIEEVAAETPEKIITVSTSRRTPACRTTRRVSWPSASGSTSADAPVRRHHQEAVPAVHVECDASLVEVNPLIVTGAAVTSSRSTPRSTSTTTRCSASPDVARAARRSVAGRRSGARGAREHDLNYVKLDGNIACMVNGAGLAMATMDLIKLHGGEPANFLDVGGGATAERVAAGVQADPLRRQGEGHPRQHLRRHRALRPDRRRHHHGGQGGGRRGAGGRAPRRHQRRTRRAREKLLAESAASTSSPPTT